MVSVRSACLLTVLLAACLWFNSFSIENFQETKSPPNAPTRFVNPSNHEVSRQEPLTRASQFFNSLAAERLKKSLHSTDASQFTPRSALISSSNEKDITYPQSVLPDKVFTIIGLESSGTTFMADTIRNALGLRMMGMKERYEVSGEGYSNHYLESDPDTKYWSEVQHVSLPWGGLDCRQDPRQHLVEVLYPALCTKLMRDHMTLFKVFASRNATPPERLQAGPFVQGPESDNVFRPYRAPEEMKRPVLDECSSLVGNQWTYPTRYSLNLTSHLDWYQDHGVDAKAIIVMRDATISRRARRQHCSNSTFLAMEEDLGREILEEAIRKYIHPAKSTSGRRRLIHSSADGRVVLMSYELLNQLKDGYLDVLYNNLGINSSFGPIWKDGNVKHVINEPVLKKKLSAIIRAPSSTSPGN